MEARSAPTPFVLGYMDSMIAMVLAEGFSINLTHHAMHALGSRVIGFSQDLYTNMQHCIPDEETARQKALVYPNVIAVAMAASHDDHAKPGPECDDQFEFEFAVDLVLGGFDVLRQRSWRSANRAGGGLIE